MLRKNLGMGVLVQFFLCFVLISVAEEVLLSRLTSEVEYRWEQRT